MTFIQALMVALIYYLGASTWIPGLGYYTVYRPLVSGLLVGIVLGDVQTGVIMGTKIQLIYMGFISAGGSQPADIGMAGTVGTALAIIMRPQLGDAALDAALSLAVALGMIGTIAYVGKMTWNAFFAHACEAQVAKGNLKGVFFWNVLAPQGVLFIVYVVPITMFLMALSGSVLDGLNTVIGYVLGPLAVVGSLLPTLGIALNMRAIAKKATLPFFFLGFLMVQYLGINIIAVSLVGLIIAYVMTFGKDETAVAAE